MRTDAANRCRHDLPDCRVRADVGPRPGRGRRRAARDLRVQLRADSRELNGHAAGRCSIPDGRRLRVPDRSGPADGERDHVDVPARLLDALAWEHVVSLVVRQQRRRCDDAIAVCGLLSALAWRRPDFRCSRSRTQNPHGRRVGCDTRRMGAYLVLFPRVRVFTLVPLGFFITSMALPAWVMLIYWMVLQFPGGSVRLARKAAASRSAHVGGFVAGVYSSKCLRGRIVSPSTNPVTGSPTRRVVKSTRRRV